MAESERKKFLLEFYKICWANITRAEDAAWKMMAAFATVIAGLSFVYEQIGVVGFLLIVFAFCFFAILLSLNANLWFVRNIGIISNLEKEFLFEEDYNVIIPCKFQKKRPFFSKNIQEWEAWWIHIIVYLIICIILLYLFLPVITNVFDKQLVGVIFCLGLLFTFIYGLSLNARYNTFINNAKGRSPKSMVVGSETKEDK